MVGVRDIKTVFNLELGIKQLTKVNFNNRLSNKYTKFFERVYKNAKRRK